MAADASEPSQDLARFASALSHELRNRLSSVKITLQTLERHLSLEEKDARRLAIALGQVGAIDELLTEVLDWARPLPPSIRPVQLSLLVDEALALVQPLLLEKNLRVEPPEGAEALTVLVDPSQGARALADLLRAAAEASAESGLVELSARRSGRTVQLAVQDHGPGLGAEERARAFDPFFTRQPRGLGLGLARARAIARRCQGELDLSSDPTGTLATLTLPGAR